jgi:hypothetical protein
MTVQSTLGAARSKTLACSPFSMRAKSVAISWRERYRESWEDMARGCMLCASGVSEQGGEKMEGL